MMKPVAAAVFQRLHRHFILCLIAAYMVGACWPQAGLWLRGVHGSANSGGWALKLMLSLLLFNAGLGIEVRQLSRLGRQWGVLLGGLLIGGVMPPLYAILAGLAIGGWLEPSLSYPLVVGLGVVSAMPAAGSSAAWSQNADGNLAVSIGLLVFSTLLSPLFAIGVLRVLATTLVADTASFSDAIGSQVACLFMTLWVVLPVAIGLCLRYLVTSRRIEPLMPYVKVVNLANLLTLNYANAALSIPSLINHPNAWVLATVTLAAVGLALCCAATAALLAWVCRAERGEKAALYFGIGMKNNGAAMVLVSTALSDVGPVLLPIICYNLVQHMAAALADRMLSPNGERVGER